MHHTPDVYKRQGMEFMENNSAKNKLCDIKSMLEQIIYYINKYNGEKNYAANDCKMCIRDRGVWGLTVVFLQMWEVCGRDEKHIDYLKYKAIYPRVGNTYCQVISDGPANNPRNPIESIYNQMIMYSNKLSLIHI